MTPVVRRPSLLFQVHYFISRLLFSWTVPLQSVARLRPRERPCPKDEKDAQTEESSKHKEDVAQYLHPAFTSPRFAGPL
jgi:hypothetical protein